MLKRTIVEGQGLHICEDKEQTCSVNLVNSKGSSFNQSVSHPGEDCKCGVNIPKMEQQIWNNSVVSFGLRDVKVSYKFEVVSIDRNMTKTLVIQPGEKVDSDCNFPPGFKTIQCRMHLKVKDKSYNYCTRRIFSENETITCQALVRGSVDPIISTVEIVKELPEKKFPEDRTYRCETSLGVIEYCIAENLNTKVIVNNEDHLVGEEYSSGQTRFQEGVCELVILPHTKNTGIWRTYIKVKGLNGTGFDYDGCIFTDQSSVKDDYIVLKEKLIKDITTVKSISFTANRTIICPTVPYPLTRCYLRMPDNKIITPPAQLFKRTSKMGICVFPNVNLQQGNLICSFNSFDLNEPDFQQEYIVEEKQSFIKVSSSVTINKFAVDLELGCKMALETELHNCLFISPSGELYHLPSSSFKSRRHSYRGEGLFVGDCGVIIKDRTMEDYHGNWTCHLDANLFQTDKSILIEPLKGLEAKN